MKSRLFAKSDNASLAFVIALLVSMCLMVMDHHYQKLRALRSTVATMVSPLQMAIDYPLSWIGSLSSFVSSKKNLLEENNRLRYQQTLLEARLQTFVTINHENVDLKALLSTASTAHTHVMAARLLAVDTSSTRQILIINKGSRDGVQIGLPVLDAKGVMGQIIDVGTITSTVLLISDSKCAVPVRNDRTGERAILVGTNQMNKLALINFPKTASIVKGDLLVTSGLDHYYPEGYPVGRVDKVYDASGDEFVQVSVTPIALLNRSRLVLLLWPEKNQNTLLTQINARLNALEGLA